MKNRLSGLKHAVWAVLAMGLALGARAENVAEVTINGTTTQYADITVAWSACKDQNATLKLLKDVDITSALNKNWNGDGDDLLLDLGGHTLKQTSVTERLIDVLGKLTVINGVLTRSVEFSGSCAGISVNYYADDESVLTRLVMRGVTMTNCVATGHGGAIYAAKNTQALLENCTLRQNAAGGSGGAIYTEGGATADGEPAKAPWDKLVLISTVITDNTAVESGAGVYYKYTVKGNSCFAAGTKVLLADGSVKVIEDVVEGEVVRTFDHEGGTNSTAEVCLTVKEPITTQIFVLTFADGYGVRCVLSHDFLMKDGDACKYVCLSRQNAADYVGKSFYAADGRWHELLSVTDGETVDEVYEIYTSQHLNSYADGLLTVPADVAHVLDIYKLDANLKADAEQLAADVAAYGLADFDEISAQYGVSRAYYDAFGTKYAYVIVGKGLMTLAEIEALYRSTAEPTEDGRASTPGSPKIAVRGAAGVRALPLAAVPKLTTSSNEDDPLADYPASCLTLGAGTIVTNNLVGTKPNNIYLEKHNSYSLIALANDRAGICAGVTPQWTTGQITACYYANPGDVALFRSDDADYAVWYALGDDGSFLKIAAGSQIVPSAVANATYEIRKDDEIIAWNEGTTVEKNSNVRVVYAADDGYVFDCSGATTKDVPVVTSTSVATMSAPDAPFYAVARSVKTDGGSSVTSYHPSLAAAVDAIGADGTGTVTMLADVTMAETGAAWVPDGADLTLDLAGKKIDWTTSKGDSLLYFADATNGKLTIKDSGVGGTISTYCDSSEVTHSALIAYCAGNGDLTVNGGTFVCSNKVGAATLFFKNGTGTWTFNGGTYKALGEGAGGAHFLYCGAATGMTRITGGTYDIRATASAAAGIASNDDCHDKITITDGDFDVITAGAWGGAFSCRNGSLVIDGGDFSVMSSAQGISCVLAERSGTTILSNGTFRAETTDGYAYAVGAAETATLTIAGGTYSSKASKDTAATVIGKEQSKVTLVGSPVINNGATSGSAWCLAVQLRGAHFDFSDYTGEKLSALAVNADDTYGTPSYVTGPMTNFNSGATWIWAGYFSTRPEDSTVQDGLLPIANRDPATKDDYPWVIGMPHRCAYGAFATPVSNYDELVELFETGGSGYLTADIASTANCIVTEPVRLCLNGHKLDGGYASGGSDYWQIHVGAALSVVDCTGTGCIYRADLPVNGSATLTVAGVSFVGGNCAIWATGGGTVADPAVITVSNCVITACKNGFYIDENVKLTVIDTLIASNTSYAVSADLNPYDGQDITLVRTRVIDNPGGISIYGGESVRGTLRLADVTVTGGADGFGGVFVYGMNVVPSGIVSVTKNAGAFVKSGESNLCLYDSEVVLGTDPLAAGSQIGVTIFNDDFASTNGVFATGSGVSSEKATLFTSDDSRYVVRYDAKGKCLRLGYEGIQVGDDAWAQIAGGTCTVVGAGAMWDFTTANPLAAYRKTLTSVEVSSGVTGIGAYAFDKFYALKNVSCAASVVSVGAGAFARSLGLERLAFGALQTDVTFGDRGYVVRAGIRMEGGEPIIWPVPEISFNGTYPTLYGKTNLTDSAWLEVDDGNRSGLRFFTYEEP